MWNRPKQDVAELRRAAQKRLTFVMDGGLRRERQARDASREADRILAALDREERAAKREETKREKEELAELQSLYESIEDKTADLGFEKDDEEAWTGAAEEVYGMIERLQEKLGYFD